MKLTRARESVLDIMGRARKGIPPIAVTYIDEQNEELVVGLHRWASANPARFEAALRRIVGDVPMRLFSTVIERQNTTKKQACRPIWGGVRMTSLSTICFPMTDAEGTLGIIISHHAVGNGTGQDVGQPDSGTIIAKVKTNPLMSEKSWRYSDSAFARKTNNRVDFTEYAIWKTADEAYDIVDKIESNHTNLGEDVIMQGAMQPDISPGQIYKKGVSISDGVVFLKNQILATYTAESGDSGAPVFRMKGESDTEIEFLGIHAGRFDDGGTYYPYYSPWEAIKAELNL